MVIVQVFTSIAVGLVTFYLSIEKKMGAVRASAFTTLLFSGLLGGLNTLHPIGVDSLYKITFGASFVGMCSSDKFRYIDVFIASLIFILIFIFLYPHTPYQGGALGFSAFLAVSTIFVVKKLLKM